MDTNTTTKIAIGVIVMVNVYKDKLSMLLGMWESVATFNKQLWNVNPLYTNGLFFLVWYNNLGIVHNTYI